MLLSAVLYILRSIIFLSSHVSRLTSHVSHDESAQAGQAGEVPVRHGMAMVRMALQSVKDDVRAIYGMDERPKTTLRAAQDIEDLVTNKRCFWTTEPLGKPVCVRFRNCWDVTQVCENDDFLYEKRGIVYLKRGILC